jgi:hypothetical protein
MGIKLEKKLGLVSVLLSLASLAGCCRSGACIGDLCYYPAGDNLDKSYKIQYLTEKGVETIEIDSETNTEISKSVVPYD